MIWIYSVLGRFFCCSMLIIFTIFTLFLLVVFSFANASLTSPVRHCMLRWLHVETKSLEHWKWLKISEHLSDALGFHFPSAMQPFIAGWYTWHVRGEFLKRKQFSRIFYSWAVSKVDIKVSGTSSWGVADIYIVLCCSWKMLPILLVFRVL